MLIKACGAIALLTVTLYLCIQASSMEIRRVRQTEAFLLLLRHIKAQISCFCMPLCDIFRDFENDSLASVGFISVLRERGFRAAIEECREKIYLDEEEINMLCGFGDELGKSYRESEMEFCDYYISTLEQSYSKSREQQPARSRLYRSLLLTGGLMVIIVFI